VDSEAILSVYETVAWSGFGHRLLRIDAAYATDWHSLRTKPEQR